jgi:hypothetical protein
MLVNGTLKIPTVRMDQGPDIPISLLGMYPDTTKYEYLTNARPQTLISECEGKDQVHSVSHTRFLRDLVQLHEPMLSPFPSGLHDSLMEWPPYLSDWGATNVKLPAWRDGVAFLVDLFLGEWARDLATFCDC